MLKIPSVLAQNAGQNSLQIVTQLKQAHQNQQPCYMGLYCAPLEEATLQNMQDKQVVELCQTKKMQLQLAIQVCIQMLKIDGVHTF